MGLLDKWNKNKFSIYSSEEKTVLKLLESIGGITEEVIKELENLNIYTKDKLNYLLGIGMYNEIKKRLEEMKESGELENIIDEIYLETMEKVSQKEDKNTNFNYNYESVVSNKIIDYSYDELVQDIAKLHDKFPQYISVENIGNSFLGRPIKAIILGKTNAKNKLLVISGHHAREQHMASIILKQIELYCQNWENKYNGERVKDIFLNSSIFCIPSINPDGLELCRIGIDSIPENYADREVLINKIKQALETKIKTNLTKNSDITENTDLPVIWVGEKGTVPNYTFRNKDMHMWKANANGVDIHYNCWEDGYNGEYVKNWAMANGYDTGFASENYIGAIGMGEPENVALKNFMDKYNLWTYSISYHGKGPTCFWNYGQEGTQLRRNAKIVDDLSKLSVTPYSPTINGQVGFAGYMISKSGTNYLTTSMIRETGWGNEVINPDNNYVDTTSPYTICPLEQWQQPHIFESEKFVPIHMLQKYVRRQDIIERENNITTLDYKTNISSNGYIFSPVDSGRKLIEQWGRITVNFQNNQNVFVTVPFPYTYNYTNIDTHANCYNNVGENKLSINCSLELHQVVIRIYSPEPITRTFNINWYSKGF